MEKKIISINNALDVLIKTKKYSSVKEILSSLAPADIALVFKENNDEKIPILFRLLPKELAARTFVEMESEDQEVLIKNLTENELKEVVDELYVDDAASLVEEMPANVAKRILNVTTPEMRKEINEILQYPDNSAGSIMTTEYISLKPEMSVLEAINFIRKTGVDKETIYTCYVTKNKTLIGSVTVKQLLLTQDDKMSISELMDKNVISVSTLSDQETVARILSKYDLLAVPVVDSENKLIGIVTFDDVMDVMVDETSEDIAIMSGMNPSDKSYLKSSAFSLFKNRIPWLLLMMISSTFTGLIITHFESSLSAIVALTAFIPMLMGTGGNTGSQSSVTVIRGISLGEVKFFDLPKVVWKETRVAILCGIVLAIVCFAKILLLDKMLLGNDDITVLIALVVSLALFVTVILAKIVGCVLPLIAKKLNLDPAVMSSPLITTAVDALSLIVYFVIANAILF